MLPVNLRKTVQSTTCGNGCLYPANFGDITTVDDFELKYRYAVYTSRSQLYAMGGAMRFFSSSPLCYCHDTDFHPDRDESFLELPFVMNPYHMLGICESVIQFPCKDESPLL